MVPCSNTSVIVEIILILKIILYLRIIRVSHIHHMYLIFMTAIDFYKDEMDLGGRAASSAFRLRKKRGSFRLRKRNQVDESMWMNYLPLSYLDTYYALGQRRFSPSKEVSSGTAAKSNTRNHPIEDEKRASFRLKKRPEDSVHGSEPGTKRASFRLKRILDSYKDLMGSSAGMLGNWYNSKNLTLPIMIITLVY